MIQVLRLGHRRARDARLTTHVCLTARAFGAEAVYVAEKDATLERTVRDVVKRFGGSFQVETGTPWRPFVKAWKRRGLVLHLTMYGEPLEPLVPRLRGRHVLVVVGAEKVPPELFELADFNVAIGNQPHSEVAALTITLDRLTEGAWREKEFAGPLRIVPNPRGKILINRQGLPPPQL